MPHIVAFPRWPPLTLKVPHGSNIETCSDFSENSVKEKFVQGVKIQNCSHFNETYLKLFVLTQRFRKGIVLYISDADLLTYDSLGACTGSLIHKL